MSSKRPTATILFASALSVLMLAACAQEAPAESADVTDKPRLLALSARGTEPFWRIDITDEKITLTRPDTPVETAVGPVPVAVGGGLISLGTAGPPAVKVAMTEGECSDGMSDLKYPYKAEVQWGDQTFKGCGFETAQEPKEGE